MAEPGLMWFPASSGWTNNYGPVLASATELGEQQFMEMGQSPEKSVSKPYDTTIQCFGKYLLKNHDFWRNPEFPKYLNKERQVGVLVLSFHQNH